MGLALCLAVQLDPSTLTYHTITGMLGDNHFSWIRESKMKEKESEVMMSQVDWNYTREH